MTDWLSDDDVPDERFWEDRRFEERRFDDFLLDELLLDERLLDEDFPDEDFFDEDWSEEPLLDGWGSDDCLSDERLPRLSDERFRWECLLEDRPWDGDGRPLAAPSPDGSLDPLDSDRLPSD